MAIAVSITGAIPFPAFLRCSARLRVASEGILKALGGACHVFIIEQLGPVANLPPELSYRHAHRGNPFHDTLFRMIPVTPADVVGDGHQHKLSTILGIDQCKWFCVSGVSIGGTAGQLGDSTIEASGGGIQILTGPIIIPPIALEMSFYDLTKWYLKLALNDTASVAAAV